jgi:hypothetical protein
MILAQTTGSLIEVIKQLGLFTTPLVIFYAVYGIVREYYAYQTRRKLIEQGITQEQLRTLFGSKAGPNEAALSSLKWGLMVLSLGIALFLSQLVTRGMDASGVVATTLGLMFVCAGAALVVFYRIASNIKPKG